MSTDFKSCEEIRNVSRWCAALAYILMDKVVDYALLIIIINAPNNVKLPVFLDCFVDHSLVFH